MIRRIISAGFICLSLWASSQEYEYDYTFFNNSPMPGSWFFSSTGSSGGSAIFNEKGKIPVNSEVFHTPGNSLELRFSNKVGGNWEACVFRPEKRGVDFFTESSLLSFWIYFEAGTPAPGTPAPGTPAPGTSAPGTPALDDLPNVRLITRDNRRTTPVEISCFEWNMWQRVLIPLESFGIPAANPNESVIGIVISQNENASGGDQTLFIDDIELVPDENDRHISQLPVIISAEGFDRHVDIAWEAVSDPNVRLVKIYRSENGGGFVPAGIQQPYINRYADFTGETGKEYAYMISFLDSDYKETELSAPVSATTIFMTDEQLLTMVQEACFRYYWEGAEPVSGMARENNPGRHNMIATGASGF
ncbi:MAG: hypothetical protein MUC31_04640, partial [Bacteroidales bacterium]|nr:hypothetical protein [Bacteroidales bacterium]